MGVVGDFVSILLKDITLHQMTSFSKQKNGIRSKNIISESLKGLIHLGTIFYEV